MNAISIFLFVAATVAQAAPDGTEPSPSVSPNSAATAAPAAQESKRLFFIIPNNRTSPSIGNFKPLSAREKFKIAQQDSLDPGTFALAGLFAGQAQITKANPSFGQGVAGYGRSFATGYADFFIGNYMTEALFPAVLHQDPRYFRKGSGGGWKRLGYSMGQIFVSHSDAGKRMANFSELGGNAAAVAISMSYYPDNRTARDAGIKFGTQLGVDIASNVLKEFWPELSRTFSRKAHAYAPKARD